MVGAAALMACDHPTAPSAPTISWVPQRAVVDGEMQDATDRILGGSNRAPATTNLRAALMKLRADLPTTDDGKLSDWTSRAAAAIDGFIRERASGNGDLDDSEIDVLRGIVQDVKNLSDVPLTNQTSASP